MSTVKSFPGGLKYDWEGLENVPEVLKNTPTGAAVGQILEVTRVDGEGKILEVKAVDKPSGGGSDYTLPIAGENLGGVKNGGNVVINADGTMTAPVPDSSPNVTVEPAEDDIPKVFFGGPLQQTKDEAVVPFRYVSKTQDISGYAEIKAQGNSSMNYPKKNQTVKLFKDATCTEKLKVNFKGWGKQSKFCFKANWIDITHSRNVVSARLWGDVVKSRANYAELPELLRTSPNQGAVDGFPIKVYADGVYQGRYTLNIPKDKWMANMDDELDTHCILCSEGGDSSCFRAAANINGKDWSDEIHDTVPAPILSRWNEVISFVMNSTDAEFKANLSNYFYVDSLIDYHLFGIADCSVDSYVKNQLYMTYDGQKWLATVYDKDGTWGNSAVGGSFYPVTFLPSGFKSMARENLLYTRLEQIFHEELKTRWAELRSGALSIENIINRFERFTDIAPAELVKEDYASTTGNGAFTGIPHQDTSNIQQIRGFARERLLWADNYVAALPPEVDEEQEPVLCTGISLSAESLNFTETGTQTLTATVTPDGCTELVVWESDNDSVATVYGGVVTAVANGACTITATCGDYSATCAVTVNIEENTGGANYVPGYIDDSGNLQVKDLHYSGTALYPASGFVRIDAYAYKDSLSSVRYVEYDANKNVINRGYNDGGVAFVALKPETAFVRVEIRTKSDSVTEETVAEIFNNYKMDVFGVAETMPMELGTFGVNGVDADHASQHRSDFIPATAGIDVKWCCSCTISLRNYDANKGELGADIGGRLGHAAAKNTTPDDTEFIRLLAIGNPNGQYIAIGDTLYKFVVQ